MGNFFGRYEDPDMADDRSVHDWEPTPSTSEDGVEPDRRPTPRRAPSTSSSSSASSSDDDDEISDLDERTKRAMVAAWVRGVVRDREALLAKRDPWEPAEGSGTGFGGSRHLCKEPEKAGGRGRTAQERGAWESKQRRGDVGDEKGARRGPDIRRCDSEGAKLGKAMKDNRVYVVNVQRDERRSGDMLKVYSESSRTGGRLRASNAEIEEITEQEYRRRTGVESRYSAAVGLAKRWQERPVASPKSPSRSGTASRIPSRGDGGAGSGQTAKTERATSRRESPRGRGARRTPISDAPRRGDQSVKATASCVGSPRRPLGDAVDGEGLEFVVDEPERLMNRENRPVGDCVQNWREEIRQARTMRSYEYRRDFPTRPCERGRTLHECPEPEGCKHCSSKMPALRC